jgi:hypothetical protein
MRALAIVAFSMLTFAAATATAAEREGPASPANRLHVGGYAGPLVILTPLARDPAILGGARAAIVLDQRLSLGGGGFALLNPIEAPSPERGQDPRIGFGAGGLWAQYVWAPSWDVQPTSGLMVGAGSLSHQAHSFSSTYTSSAFFFVMPEVGLEIEMEQVVRIGIEASYRIVTGVDLPGFGNGDASGPGVGVHAKLGVF